MTSRSEYRLLHRQDNADGRLTAIGYELGLISRERFEFVTEKYRQVDREIARLESSGLAASPELNALLEGLGSAPCRAQPGLADLIRRPNVSYAAIAPFDPNRPALSREVQEPRWRSL